MIDLNHPLLDERGERIIRDLIAKRRVYLDQHRHAEAHGVAMSVMIVWRGLTKAQGPAPDSVHADLDMPM
jgi:hypothetical protein